MNNEHSTNKDTDFEQDTATIHAGMQWSEAIALLLLDKTWRDYGNGHRLYLGRCGNLESIQGIIWPFTFGMAKKNLLALRDAAINNTPLDDWISLNYFGRIECRECGEYVTMESNGVEIRATTPCEYGTEGLKAYTTELRVPSGAVVMADYLHTPKEDYKIELFNDSTKGLMQVALEAENKGFAHAFCGNSCPGVYANKEIDPDHLRIAGGYTQQAEQEGFLYLANIITDLWWYTIADYEEYQSHFRGKKIPKRELESGLKILDCKPGIYKVTHHGHYVDRDISPVLYAEMVWDREID